MHHRIGIMTIGVCVCLAAAEGLELLCGPTGGQAAVRSYAIKCLFNTHPEKVCVHLVLSS